MQHAVMQTPLDTDVKKVAEAEASIALRLEGARKKADKIVADSRAEKLETIEKAAEQASLAKQSEVEQIRKQVSAECQEITKQAQVEAAKIQSTASKEVAKKLLEEFKNLVVKEARK